MSPVKRCHLVVAHPSDVEKTLIHEPARGGVMTAFLDLPTPDVDAGMYFPTKTLTSILSGLRHSTTGPGLARLRP